MTQHVARVASVCFYHICRLRQIRHCIGQEVTTQFVLAMVMMQFDYCYSLLAGLLQSAVDAGATAESSELCSTSHLQSRASGSRHASSTATALAANPSSRTVQGFKLCTLVYGICSRQCPAYLSDAMQSVMIISTREGLQSAETTNYATPRLRSKFGE